MAVVEMKSEQKQGYAWLEETDKNEGSLVYAKKYTGPQLQLKDLA